MAPRKNESMDTLEMLKKTDGDSSSLLSSKATNSGSFPGPVENWVPSDVYDKSISIPQCGDKFTGYLGDHNKNWPLLKRLNYLHLFILSVPPALAAYGLLTTSWDWRTFLFAVAYYFFAGIGITGGYHRLFAHKSYSAHWLLRGALVLMGTAAVEGSVKWWARDHRAHHKYVDTEEDPYSAIKGFFYAHVGWMLVKQEQGKIGRVDISDLMADPVIRWQHRNYLWLVLLMGAVVPTVVPGLLWGDYRGGFFLAGMARLVFVHHSTFFVNSLAHYAGSATFTDENTARNSWITALLTVGEGAHNFHHNFANDYRNGVEWYEYDPTKWFIYAMNLLGLAYDLHRFTDNEVAKGKLQMKQKALDGRMRELFWGPDPASLPVMSKEQVALAAAAGRDLLILDGFVLDTSLHGFKKSHPGGEGYINSFRGQDMSSQFKGEVYKHSSAAKNLTATLRVARVQGYWS